MRVSAERGRVRSALWELGAAAGVIGGLVGLLLWFACGVKSLPILEKGVCSRCGDSCFKISYIGPSLVCWRCFDSFVKEQQRGI